MQKKTLLLLALTTLFSQLYCGRIDEFNILPEPNDSNQPEHNTPESDVSSLAGNKEEQVAKLKAIISAHVQSYVNNKPELQSLMTANENTTPEEMQLSSMEIENKKQSEVANLLKGLMNKFPPAQDEG